MLKKSTGIFLALLLLTASFSEIGSAKGSTAQSFPIGIFWPPSPANTSSASYADISAMNVNFIVGGNGLSDYSSNDAALGYAADHGLTLLVDDSRLAWRDQVVSQNSSGHGLFVSSTSSLGQTIRTPKGTGWGLNQVQLQIDQLNWPAGTAITLHLYDSPAKNQLIASNTLTAPVSTFYPVFNMHTAVQSDTVYYLELTSDSPTPIGWITTSTSSTYENGQAYLNGVAQSVDLWFNLNYSQRAYNDGSAYLNGTPIEADFWFTINQNIKGASYEDYVYRWMYTEPDVLVFDHYPFLANGQFRPDYYDNLETIRRQAKLGGVDFWSYIQSVGVTGVWKAPSESEMRYQIYSNLAYGAKGYIYFTYWTPEASGGESFHNGLILPDGTKNASYLWAQNLNAEVLQLGNTLMELQSLAVYHTGNDLPSSTTILPASFVLQPNSTVPLVIGEYEDQAGQQYVMIVNKSTVNQHTITFSADSSINNIKEIAKADGQLKATNFNNGDLSVQLAPGEGKLFRLE